jgi:hypothetical protein
MFAPTQSALDPEKGTLDVVFPSDLTQTTDIAASTSSASTPVIPNSPTPFLSTGSVDKLGLPTLHTQDKVFSTVDIDGVQMPSPDSPPCLPPAIPEKAFLSEKPDRTAIMASEHLKNKPAQFKVTWKRANRWIQFKLWFNTYR